MRRIFYYTLFLLGLRLGERFVSPGPGVIDQAPNAVYFVGSSFYIAWEDTDDTRPVSIVLFQTHEDELVYPFEYIEQRLTGRGSTEWTVAITKDLEFSNTFLFNLFYDGDSSPAAISQHFNITDTRKVSTRTPSPSSTTQVTTSTTFSTSAGPMSTTTETPSKEDTHSGMSTGAKVGLGVAVPMVVVLGIAIGYFLKTCLAKRSSSPPASNSGPGQDPMEQTRPLGPVAGHSHELESHHQFSKRQDAYRDHELPHELYSDPAHR